MIAAHRFNTAHKHIKRGLAIVPVKVQLQCPSSAARVQIMYGGEAMPLDGSVVVEVSGVELGQGLFTKCAQAAAESLSKTGVRGGVPLEYIRVKGSNSHNLPSVFPTGGGTTSELCVDAVEGACMTLVERLTTSPVLTALRLLKGAQKDKSISQMTWGELVSCAGLAHLGVVDLTASEFCTFGAKNHRGVLNWAFNALKEYSVVGCGVSEVEVDCLTGEVCVLGADLVYDAARSLNPVIDLGQIQGSYVQGMGMVLREGFEWNQDGSVRTKDHWTYKAPVAADVPTRFNVSYYKGQDQPTVIGRRIFGSKSTGEVPLLLATSLVGAILDLIIAHMSIYGNNHYYCYSVGAILDLIIAHMSIYGNNHYYCY